MKASKKKGRNGAPERGEAVPSVHEHQELLHSAIVDKFRRVFALTDRLLRLHLELPAPPNRVWVRELRDSLEVS